MASNTGPDLSFAQEAVERLQDDACIITRGSAAATLNQTTGKIEAPPAGTIYGVASTGEGGRSLADEDGTGGRCSVSYKSNARASYRTEGGRQVLDTTPEASLPLDAPLVVEGDILVVTSSRRDPQLVGQRFRVADVVEGSMSVKRRIVLEKQ